MEDFSMDGYEISGALASHVLARLYLIHSHSLQVFDARTTEDREKHIRASLVQVEALIAIASVNLLKASDIGEI